MERKEIEWEVSPDSGLEPRGVGAVSREPKPGVPALEAPRDPETTRSSRRLEILAFGMHPGLRSTLAVRWGRTPPSIADVGSPTDSSTARNPWSDAFMSPTGTS